MTSRRRSSHAATAITPGTPAHRTRRIAMGRWIIAHSEVPRVDVFSFSMQGAPFTPPEWLAEIGIAWLYDRFGWGALVAATALSVAAALTMLLRALLRNLMPAHALIA